MLIDLNLEVDKRSDCMLKTNALKLKHWYNEEKRKEKNMPGPAQRVRTGARNGLSPCTVTASWGNPMI